MIANKIRRAGLAAAVAVTCSGQLSLPAHQESAIRELVAREASVEIGAWRTDVPLLAPAQVSLRRLESTAPGVELWEAHAPMDHWHRYVVAQRGSQVWRLGGFAANDLPEYYNAILRETAMPGRQDETGSYLVALADPNGKEIVFPSRRTDPDSLIRSWVARRPANWPADTAHVLADGGRFLRLTALSKQENSYDQPWVPAVFTFVFDAQGYLKAWYRREGAVIR